MSNLIITNLNKVFRILYKKYIVYFFEEICYLIKIYNLILENLKLL